MPPISPLNNSGRVLLDSYEALIDAEDAAYEWLAEFWRVCVQAFNADAPTEGGCSWVAVAEENKSARKPRSGRPQVGMIVKSGSAEGPQPLSAVLVYARDRRQSGRCPTTGAHVQILVTLDVRLRKHAEAIRGGELAAAIKDMPSNIDRIPGTAGTLWVEWFPLATFDAADAVRLRLRLVEIIGDELPSLLNRGVA